MTPVTPPPLRPENDAAAPAGDWRTTGPAAQVLAMPPPAPRAAPKLKTNARPLRDLRTLIERVGRAAVERQLNVHRTTVLRWLEGKVKIPGHQHQVIRMLLGDLPGTAGQWQGWRFWEGVLISPSGDKFDPGQVLSLILLKQQLAARDREVLALKVQLAMAEQALARAPDAAAANDARAAG